MTGPVTVDALKAAFFQKPLPQALLNSGLTGLPLDEICATYFSAAGIDLRNTVPSPATLSLTATLVLPNAAGAESSLPANVSFVADPSGVTVTGLSITAGDTSTQDLCTRPWEIPKTVCASVKSGFLQWCLAASSSAANVIAQLTTNDALLGVLKLECDGADLAENYTDANGRWYRFTQVFAPGVSLDANLSALEQYACSLSPLDTLVSLWPTAIPLSSQPVLEELAFDFCCASMWQASALAHVDASIQGVPAFKPVDELTVGPLLGTFSMIQQTRSRLTAGSLPSLTLSAQAQLSLGSLPPLIAVADITTQKTDSGYLQSDPDYFSPDPGYFELLLEGADPDDPDDDTGLPTVGDLFHAVGLPSNKYLDIPLGSIMVAGILSTSEMDYSLQLRYEQPVHIGDRIEVEGALLMIDKIGNQHTGAFEGAFRIEDSDFAVDVVLSGAHDSSGWSFSALASIDQRLHPLRLSTLFSFLASAFDLSASDLPAFTDDIHVTQFSFDVTDDGIAAEVNFVIGSEASAVQPITFALALSIFKAEGTQAYQTTFGGTVQFGTTATFSVLACLGNSISLELDATTGPVTIGELCTAMGLPMSANEGPEIKVAALRYDTPSGAVGFLLEISAGTAVGVFVPATSGNQAMHLVQLFINADLTFSNTGLAIPGIPPNVDFGLPTCVLTLASNVIDAPALAAASAYLPSNAGWTEIVTLPVPSGTTLWTPFSVGANVIAESYSAGETQRSAAIAAAAAPTMYYINIEMALGPVALHRLGLGYRDGAVQLAIDGGFSIDALTIDFIGLVLGATFKGGLLPPALNGLAVSFAGDALSLSGELVVSDDGGGRSYDGTIAMQTADLSISALGSWIGGDGDPSMFVYGELTSEAQGPEPLLVRGLSAGFGVSRDFLLPTVDEITQFPFVEAAMADATHPSPFSHGIDPTQVLAQVKQYVPPHYGNLWGAAGVRFTSFGVIDGFALATVSFGASSNLSLLGVAQAAFPKNSADPIAYIEVELEAQWSFGDGKILAVGTLSPNSFALDPSAELRGGFAFSAWLTNDPASGAKAGDFVYSIGGYNPGFSPPAYYPTVPRMSLNWQRGALAVVGDGYFALTGAGIMAGGALSVTWASGPVKAWFDAYVDFLMGWHPFIYAADIGVSIGASFTIDLLFTSVTMTVHVGVDLALEGPPFHGEADVDLDVISFHIPFGDDGDSAERQFLSWDDFVTGFFPVPDKGAPNLARINIARGLRQSPTDHFVDSVIDGSAFQIRTLTSIPATAAEVAIGPFAPTPVTATWNTQVGVRPAGVAAGSFTAVHQVSVSSTNGQLNPASVRLRITPILNGAMATAWGATPGNTVSLTDLKTPIVANAFTGFSIEPDHAVEALPGAMPVAQLLFQNEGQALTWYWLTPSLPPVSPHASDARTAVMQTVMADSQSRRRADILAAARRAGFGVSEVVSLKAMVKDFIAEAPALKRLGEE